MLQQLFLFLKESFFFIACSSIIPDLEYTKTVYANLYSGYFDLIAATKQHTELCVYFAGFNSLQ